jgi:hypothetical protein
MGKRELASIFIPHTHDILNLVKPVKSESHLNYLTWFVLTESSTEMPIEYGYWGTFEGTY